MRGAEAIRIAEASDYPYCLVAVHFAAGYLYLCKGELPQAIPMFERCLALCQALHLPNWFLAIASVLGYAYALAGRVAEAVPLLEQAMERATSVRLVLFWASAAWLSETALLAGRLDDAIALARRALEISRERKERGYEAWALRLLGEVAMRREPPDVDQAAGHYHQALALAEELGMRPLVAHCHLGLGTLYSKIGHVEPVRTELAAALELYRAMDMTFWLPQVEAALVQVES